MTNIITNITTIFISSHSLIYFLFFFQPKLSGWCVLCTLLLFFAVIWKYTDINRKKSLHFKENKLITRSSQARKILKNLLFGTTGVGVRIKIYREIDSLTESRRIRRDLWSHWVEKKLLKKRKTTFGNAELYNGMFVMIPWLERSPKLNLNRDIVSFIWHKVERDV